MVPWVLMNVVFDGFSPQTEVSRPPLGTPILPTDERMSAAPDTPQTLLKEGTLVGDRYRLGNLLGQGGFAMVYEANDELIGRPVALKVLHLPETNYNPEHRAKVLKRFRQEARLAALIRHPNVVTIHDIGVTRMSGQPYIVMELLQGHTLEYELRHSGPMDPERVLPCFIRALEGLAVGHDLGIVHKDLKPDNLFLIDPGTARENLRIVDFGIARVDEEDRLTGMGQVTGTPQYLAPEYIESQTVTPGLDVYQMGLILSEVLTGVRAVEGHLMSCMIKHTHGQLHLPEPLLASALGPVIRKATALNPAKRYKDAEALRLALMEIDASRLPLLAVNNDENLLTTLDSHEVVLGPPTSSNVPALERPAPPSVETKGLLGVADTVGYDDEASTLSRSAEVDLPAADSEPQPQARPEPPNTQQTGAVTSQVKRERVIMGSIILALVVGLGWILTQDHQTPPGAAETLAAETANKKTEPPQQPEKAPEPTPTKAVPVADAGAEPVAKPDAGAQPVAEADAAGQATPPEDKTITVEVRTSPCRATIYEGRKKLGVSPVKVTFDGPDAAARKLAASCPLHQRRYFSVQPDGPDVRSVQLRPSIPLPD